MVDTCKASCLFALPSSTPGGSECSQDVWYLLLSPSCSVMFRLNRMLFLQPPPEPNGENGSENHIHIHSITSLS